MVEILLAVYNAEKYLPEMLDSIYNQDYTDFLITVSDDCSKDNTVKILNEYKEKHGKMRIVSSGEDLGAKGNFRWLINHADADYIMFADHDDKWLPDKISTTLAAMQAAECAINGPVLVHTDLSVTDADLNITEKSFVKSQGFDMSKNRLCDFLAQNTVTGCAMMINRELLELAKNIPDDALMHDWWLALTASAFGKAVFLDVPTILYRQHGNNQVGAVKSDYVKDRKQTAKNRLYATYKQADAFYKAFGDKLSEKNRKAVKAYADCMNKNKFHKIATIIKYKTRKQGLVKFLAQIFYC